MTNFSGVNVGVGDIVEFIYDAGSHPGSTRVVRVEEARLGQIKGHDYTVNGFRHFYDSGARSARVIGNVNTHEIIDVNEIKKAKIGEARILSNSKGALKLVAVPNTHILLAEKLNTGTLDVSVDDSQCVLTLKNGKEVATLSLKKDGVQQVNLEDFVSSLATLIGKRLS